jgi:apolipoprotein N-acyltransferase
MKRPGGSVKCRGENPRSFWYDAGPASDIADSDIATDEAAGVSPVKGLLIRSTLTRLARLIVPPDIEVRKRRLELTIWSFLLSLSFYPGPFGFLAWLSLVRPAIILSRLHGREAFNAAYFFGFFFNAFSLYWVVQVTPPGILAAVIIVAFYYAAVLSLFVRLYHVRPFLGIWSLPFLWVGMEYFRTLSQFAFPWSDLGYSQSYYLYILQIVSVISVHGLSFLIVIANVLLWQVLRKEVSLGYRFLSFWGAVGIVVVLVSYGYCKARCRLKTSGRQATRTIASFCTIHSRGRLSTAVSSCMSGLRRPPRRIFHMICGGGL